MKDASKTTGKRIRNAVTKATVGTVTAASVLTGSLFEDPGEILAQQNADPAVTEPVLSDTRYPGQAKPASKQTTLAERARSTFLRLPTAVRALVILPLWCVGSVIISVSGLLIQTLAPFWKILLMFVLEAGLLLGLFAFLYHLIFPDRPVRNLLKKENLLPLLFLAAFLAVTDFVLSSYFSQYRTISALVKIGLGFAVLILLCHRFFHTKRSDRTVSLRPRE